MQCRNNIKQIGLALHNYESTYRMWPAHSSFPVPGGGFQTPRGSWFTRILPYLDQDGLLRIYDQNRDWDDPLNSAAVKTRVGAYSCPSVPDREGFEWTVLVTY